MRKEIQNFQTGRVPCCDFESISFFLCYVEVWSVQNKQQMHFKSCIFFKSTAETYFPGELHTPILAEYLATLNTEEVAPTLGG